MTAHTTQTDCIYIKSINVEYMRQEKSNSPNPTWWIDTGEITFKKVDKSKAQQLEACWQVLIELGEVI